MKQLKWHSPLPLVGILHLRRYLIHCCHGNMPHRLCVWCVYVYLISTHTTHTYHTHRNTCTHTTHKHMHTAHTCHTHIHAYTHTCTHKPHQKQVSLSVVLEESFVRLLHFLLRHLAVPRSPWLVKGHPIPTAFPRWSPNIDFFEDAATCPLCGPQDKLTYSHHIQTRATCFSPQHSVF